MYSDFFESKPETRYFTYIFFPHFNDFEKYYVLAQKLIALSKYLRLRYSQKVSSAYGHSIGMNQHLFPPPQPLRHPTLLAQIHTDINPRLDPLEAGT